MVEYERMAERQRKWMLYLLLIFFVGAMLLPYKRVILGLLLGHVVSYYSLRLLHNRAKAFGEAIVEEKRSLGLGTFLRLLGAALAIIIAMKFEHKIHIIAVVFGLITSYIVIVADYTIYSIRQQKKT